MRSFLGPSGSGKRRLLRCLEFFEQADSGEVLFDDIDVDLRTVTKEQIKAIRQKTAFVFQNHLFNNVFKTALENFGIVKQCKIYEGKYYEAATYKVTSDKDIVSSRPTS